MVRTSARPCRAMLGGIDCMPRALRTRASTTTSLTKQVPMTMRKGSMPRPPRSSNNVGGSGRLSMLAGCQRWGKTVPLRRDGNGGGRPFRCGVTETVGSTTERSLSHVAGSLPRDDRFRPGAFRARFSASPPRRVRESRSGNHARRAWIRHADHGSHFSMRTPTRRSISTSSPIPIRLPLARTSTCRSTGRPRSKT